MKALSSNIGLGELWRVIGERAEQLARRVSRWNRERKWVCFRQVIGVDHRATILDVGAQNEDYSIVDNYIEKHYPYPDKITALGIEPLPDFARRYPLVHCVVYPGGEFPFTDKQFDVVWSNAVLEHVGDFDAQVAFLRQIKRVGRRMFITTPNARFPVELHTRLPMLHYLPKSMFDWLLKRIGKNWATGAYMNLLSERHLRRALELAGIFNYQLYRNRLAGFVLDFVVVADFRGSHEGQ